MVQPKELKHCEQNEAKDLRMLLQAEFISRCRRNSVYSMRAFAKFLGIDQSLLSKIMKGERKISKASALSLGAKIGLKPSEIDEALGATKAGVQFHRLADDQFSSIASWYHFALLELSKTKGFRSDAQKIANRLGIHIEEARSAIERLQRLGLIRLEKGTWSLNSANNTWTNNQVTTEARKLLQKSLLEKSIDAIETVPFEMRDNGSLTVAVNKKRLPEFKQKLKQIRQELGSFFQSDSELDEVYQLTVSFFPLSKIEGDLP
jgi:uncharacterized protein (TIGR02147 family)